MHANCCQFCSVAIMYSAAVRGWLVAAAVLALWKGPEITWAAPTTDCSCPSPWLLKHSTFAPVLPAGTNFTGYCNFTIGSAQPEIVGGTKIDWSARPVDETYTTSEQWAADNLTVTTTITILNISQDSSGVYLAKITNKCGSISCKLILYVPRPCEYEPPNPRNATHLSIIVPESPQLLLRVDYTGDPDPNHYDIMWQRPSHGNLVHYHTNHTRLAECAFSSTLTISNVSYSESGNYTALPYGLYSSANDSRTNVTIDLRVIPWPVVTEHPGESVQLHSSSRTILTYRISNYTQYVRVLFTRNGTVIDPSQPGYNVTVSPSGDVPCNASVSLMISNGQTGDYRMCTGFTSAVNTSSDTQCTVSTTVTRGTANQAQGKHVLLEAVCGGGGGCLLLAIVVVAAAIAYKRRCRPSAGRRHPEEDRLLEDNRPNYEAVIDEIERDSPISKVQGLLQRCVPRSFDDVEFDSIAQWMLQCAAVCPETLAVHLGNTGACSEVRYRSGNNPRAVYRGVLKAWFDDIPYMEPAIETRKRLVRIIFKLEVFELAEAIALKTYTRIM